MNKVVFWCRVIPYAIEHRKQVSLTFLQSTRQIQTFAARRNQFTPQGQHQTRICGFESSLVPRFNSWKPIISEGDENEALINVFFRGRSSNRDSQSTFFFSIPKCTTIKWIAADGPLIWWNRSSTERSSYIIRCADPSIGVKNNLKTVQRKISTWWPRGWPNLISIELSDPTLSTTEPPTELDKMSCRILSSLEDV